MLRRYLAGICVLVVWSAGAAFGAEPVGYKLEYIPVKKVEVTGTETHKVSGGDVKEWVIFQFLPPPTPRQNITIKLEPGGQEGTSEPPEKSPLLFIRKILPRVAHDSEFTYKTLYTGTVCQVRLVPLEPGEKPPVVAALSPEARKLYMARTKDVDYDSAEVKAWLDKEGLHRRHGERDLDFARRVFLAIRTSMTYKDPGEGKRASGTASQTAAAHTGVCQGLTHLFAAALRANGIPARCVNEFPVRMVGVFSRDDMGTLSHINSEFYADGIGWVPCDASNSAGAATEEAALESFSRDDGLFMGLGPEEDSAVRRMVDTATFGGKSTPRANDPWEKGTYSGSGGKRWIGDNPNGKEDIDSKFVINTEPLVAEKADPTGEPIVEGYPGAFRIWRDESGWHVRGRGVKDFPLHFNMTITAVGGKIEKYRHAGETKDMVGGTKISLKTSANAEVGFDFQVSAETKQIRFDLFHTDSSPSPYQERAYLGKNKTLAIQMPFLLDTSPVAAGRAGSQPAVVTGPLELRIAAAAENPTEIICQAHNPGKVDVPVELFGKQGNILHAVLPDGGEISLATSKDKTVAIPAGQTVEWRVDISHWEKCKQPGVYKLTWKVGEQASPTISVSR